MSSTPSRPLRHSITPAKQGARRHYGSHPYFTKRAWNVVQAYIKHFSFPEDTVLDPFGGSGVTAVESLVLRRRAVYADISSWACFLARQTAIAPVSLSALQEAFAHVECSCRDYLADVWATPNSKLENRPVADWYPKDVPLPSNSDVPRVEDLFTPRMLHGLARLRACIMKVEDRPVRDLLLLAFSATLVRVNRTFLSAKNRRESRGGSAIFSIYRYKVAKNVVEMPLWEQFEKRFSRLLDAKRETNQLIGDYYREDDTAVFRHASATRLLDWIKPGTIDYIYTDPPYGGHIAYLDLSTMWAAWLGFPVTREDRSAEIIEGGELRKSHTDYHELMSIALQQMHETLKHGAWMSIVFAHRDTSYWESLVSACREAGFQYVNTVVQPVRVVWSMHKKKNPLRVLSGELVLNFRKSPGPVRVSNSVPEVDGLTLLHQCCEKEIVRHGGASTESLHHAIVPKLLERGLLTEFSRKFGDITPLLEELFEFDPAARRWQLRNGQALAARHSKTILARYHIVRFLALCEREKKPPTASRVYAHVQSLLSNGEKLEKRAVRGILARVAYSPDGRHWRLTKGNRQQELFITG